MSSSSSAPEANSSTAIGVTPIEVSPASPRHVRGGQGQTSAPHHPAAASATTVASSSSAIPSPITSSLAQSVKSPVGPTVDELLQLRAGGGGGPVNLSRPASAASNRSQAVVTTRSMATMTSPLDGTLDDGDDDGPQCSRVAFYRLQRQLREERSALLREVLHARQNVVRLEHQLVNARQSLLHSHAANRGSHSHTASPARDLSHSQRGGDGQSVSPFDLHASPSGNNSTSPAAGMTSSLRRIIDSAQGPTVSLESMAAMQTSVEEIARALHRVDAQVAIAEEFRVELSQARQEFERRLESERAQHAARVAELEAEVRDAHHQREQQTAAFQVQAKRVRRDAEVAVTNYASELTSTCDRLKRELSEAQAENEKLQAEVAEHAHQAAQQSLVVSRLQQQLTEAAHERAEMRSALDTAAANSGPLLLALQQQQKQQQQQLAHPHQTRRRSSAVGLGGDISGDSFSAVTPTQQSAGPTNRTALLTSAVGPRSPRGSVVALRSPRNSMVGARRRSPSTTNAPAASASSPGGIVTTPPTLLKIAPSPPAVPRTATASGGQPPPGNDNGGAATRTAAAEVTAAEAAASPPRRPGGGEGDSPPPDLSITLKAGIELPAPHDVDVAASTPQRHHQVPAASAGASFPSDDVLLLDV